MIILERYVNEIMCTCVVRNDKWPLAFFSANNQYLLDGHFIRPSFRNWFRVGGKMSRGVWSGALSPGNFFFLDSLRLLLLHSVMNPKAFIQLHGHTDCLYTQVVRLFNSQISLKPKLQNAFHSSLAFSFYSPCISSSCMCTCSVYA